MQGSRAPSFPWRLLIALGLCPLFVQFGVLNDFWVRIASGLGLARFARTGVVAASAVPHTFIYLGLLAIFGWSLRPRSDAIVTALARHMYGAIPQDMILYTRRVTWGWCGYFAAQLGTSLILYLTAPLGVWSFFVNVLNVPLFTAMFLAEQWVRPFFLRDAPTHSPSDVLRMLGIIKAGLWRGASK